MNPFRETIDDARRLFLETHEMAGAALDSVELPGARGPAGEALFMDMARRGSADADVLLLTLSGTHGGEGYAGSAMQSFAAAEGMFDRLPGGVAVAQIHAVNPWGMAHYVRTNENGVDMNRNWIDFLDLPPLPEFYERVIPGLPEHLHPCDAVYREWEAAIASLREQWGRWAVDDAVSAGQFRFPDGFGFGGQEPQWSRRALETFIARARGSARHVVYIDWHTLLRTGDGTLIHLCFNEPGSPLFQRAAQWWGEGVIDRERVNQRWAQGTAAAPRRPSRNGLLMWGMQHALAPTTDLAGAVIEFCTEPDPELGPDQLWTRETVCERFLVNTRDFNSSAGTRARELLRRCLYPDSSAFRNGALRAGSGALRAALAGAGGWAEERLPAAPGRLLRSGGF